MSVGPATFAMTASDTSKCHPIAEKTSYSPPMGKKGVISDPESAYEHLQRWIIGASGPEVKVWSISSGKCAQTLQGHKAEITALAANPHNSLQVFSSSVDHTLIKWDFLDGVQLQQYHVPCLVAMMPTHTEDNHILALACNNAPLSEQATANLVQFKLPQSSECSEGRISSTTLLCDVKSQDNSLAMGCQGQYVAAVGRYKLLVQPLRDDKPALTWKLGSLSKQLKLSGEFCSVAAHPTDACVATGMMDGKIVLWWNVLSKKNMVTSIQHWHSLPVTDLTYTPEGSYLLSGGHECVLVKWQHNTSHREFLPRLGSPITRLAVAPDNTLYALCQADNAIRIVSSNLKLIQIIQGLTKCKGHSESQGRNSLVLDPRTGSLVLRGRPGHLQFYSFQTDTQLYNLDIVRQNYISPESLQRPLVHTEVAHWAFNARGTWLATVEQRIDHCTSPDIALKFWHLDNKAQSYTLNTSVELPHWQGVESLAMRPLSSTQPSLQAVTTSKDCCFKLWTYQVNTDTPRCSEQAHWSCDSVAFYRDLPPSLAAYTQDGSLLAVVFSSTVTLWDPDNNELCETLEHPSPVSQLACCTGRAGHLLLTATASTLYAWNLLSCTVQWCVSLQVSVIAVNTQSEIVAVITRDNTLQIFNPENSRPVCVHRDMSLGQVCSAVFVPEPGLAVQGPHSWMHHSRLYLFNNRQELYEVKLAGSSTEPSTAGRTQKLRQDVPRGPLPELLQGAAHSRLGLASQLQHDEAATHTSRQASEQFLTQMLTVPAHVLPPTASLCLSFLNTLLPASSDAAGGDKEKMSDELSDEDMDITDDELDTEMQALSSEKHPGSSKQTQATNIGIIGR